MNLIGKILTVVIFILSIIFMTMVLAIYATHTNWRDAVMNPLDKATATKPLGLKYALEDETKLNQELKDKLDKLKQEKDKELDAKVQALTKLENENSLMKDQIKQLQESIVKYDDSERKAVAALQATQKESAIFRGEVEGLRSEAEKAQSDRDAHFKEVVKITDEMHQMLNEMTELKSRNTTLSADLAKAREVLRHFDLNENTDISGTPPRVEGLIEAVLGGGLTEISIGSDSGVQKGHKLDVYRVAPTGNKYVGRIEVLKTAPDKSVCKIIPSFQQSEVQKGDRVASKIE
jgi:peptidoglycan hydrolase CwlO-like protein